MSRIASNLNNTQDEVTMLHSSVPPPNYQPNTPSKTAFNFPPIVPSYPGLSLPPVMSSNIGLNLPTTTSNHSGTSNATNQTICPCTDRHSVMTITNVSAVLPDSNIVKASNMPTITSTNEAVDVLKQPTINKTQGNKQETGIKKIIEAILSDRKYSLKFDVQGQSSKQNNDKTEK